MAITCHNCARENRDTSKFCSGCGTKLSVSSTGNLILPEGTVLENRYVITGIIKAGLRGGVYKCVDNKLDNLCAVKELLPPYGTADTQAKSAELFNKNVKNLARLLHPGLPKITDYFVSKGRYYIVMDFIEGEILKKRLEKEGNPGLPEEKIIVWSGQILEVLNYLHSQKPPLIYSDLRPGKIIINKDENAILMHMGLEKIIYQGSKETQRISGYIPEEQMRNRAEPSSDIYALGATMHHLLTGVEPLPFRFEPPRKIISKISISMERIVMKALKDDPSERFSGAKEMLEALPFKPEFSLLKVTKKKSSPEKQSKRIIWEFQTGGTVRSSPCVSDDMVYFGSWDSKLYCLNGRDGEKLWDFKTGWHVYSSPVIWDGSVYFGSCDKKFYCVNAKDGKKVWDFDTGGYIYSSPCVRGSYVYFGSSDKKLYCVSAKSGQKIWDFDTDGIVYSNPLVVKDRIYFGSGDRNIYCLDIKEGRKIWAFKTFNEIGSSPCVSDNFIYFGGLDKRFYCLYRDTGKPVWEFKTGLGIYSSPVISDDLIYFGGLDKKFYCLNTKDGKKLWDFHAESMIYSTPSIAEGLIYFGTWDKNLFCLELKKGNKIWDTSIGLGIYSSPCFYKGLIYFGNEDHKLYCVSTARELE